MRTRRSIIVTSQTMSAPSNTGPPMHERTKCDGPVAVAHGNDAAVAAAEAAAHHALDRDFVTAADIVRRASPRRRASARARTRRPSTLSAAGEVGERLFERRGDATATPAAAVFGGEHQLHAEPFEEVEVEQLPVAARAVEQRRRRAGGGERFGQRRKRREADAAGDHPRLARRRRS